MRPSMGQIYVATAMIAVTSGLVTFFGEGLNVIRGVAGGVYVISMLFLAVLTATFWMSRH